MVFAFKDIVKLAEQERGFLATLQIPISGSYQKLGDSLLLLPGITIANNVVCSSVDL